ncbi:hypothetical protein WMY93_002915 [Mugilogobius chulae]|uniref:Uncharacterized protein n=1 Tax=Mugilogobius chulae TaxID=88201 RepID=A0AAW0PY05_9GOBI
MQGVLKKERREALLDMLLVVGETASRRFPPLPETKAADQTSQRSNRFTRVDLVLHARPLNSYISSEGYALRLTANVTANSCPPPHVAERAMVMGRDRGCDPGVIYTSRHADKYNARLKFTVNHPLPLSSFWPNPLSGRDLREDESSEHKRDVAFFVSERISMHTQPAPASSPPLEAHSGAAPAPIIPSVRQR